MPLKTLRFLIRQDGRVEESVSGVQGKSCQALTEKLEDALGSVEINRPTSEAYALNLPETQSIRTELH